MNKKLIFVMILGVLVLGIFGVGKLTDNIIIKEEEIKITYIPSETFGIYEIDYHYPIEENTNSQLNSKELHTINAER